MPPTRKNRLRATGGRLMRSTAAPMNASRLVRQGGLLRLARGVYAKPDARLSEHVTSATVALKYPAAVICLLSALRFHGLTTQQPFEVWVAIGGKARKPVSDYPPLRVMRFAAPLLAEGVETHVIDGVPVKITGVAQTVADCFKYRNKIGLDVALEALRDALARRLTTRDALWHAAVSRRVANVMRPYLEALS